MAMTTRRQRLPHEILHSVHIDSRPRLSRLFQSAFRRGLLERMPLFPNRLEENPPREGFFEHDEYLKVRAHAPASYQDVLDFAYYSGWRRNEILDLT